MLFIIMLIMAVVIMIPMLLIPMRMRLEQRTLAEIEQLDPVRRQKLRHRRALGQRLDRILQPW